MTRPKLVPYECTKCEAIHYALRGSAVSHACPKAARFGQQINFVPLEDEDVA